MIADRVTEAIRRIEREAGERHSKSGSEQESTTIELHRIGSLLSLGLEVLADALELQRSRDAL